MIESMVVYRETLAMLRLTLSNAAETSAKTPPIRTFDEVDCTV
jgi:hypothetical protein